MNGPEPEWKDQDDKLKLSDEDEPVVEAQGHYDNVTDAAGGTVGLLMNGPEEEWKEQDDKLKLSDDEPEWEDQGHAVKLSDDGQNFDDVQVQDHYGNVVDAAGGTVGLLMNGPEEEWEDQDDKLKLSDDEE